MPTDFLQYQSGIFPLDIKPNHHYFNYFFFAGGSDVRSYRTLQIMRDMGIQIDKPIMFDFKERRDFAKSNGIGDYEAYKDFGYEVTEYPCSLRDFFSLKELTNHLDMKSDVKIALDISCFTKPYFFSLIRLFSLMKNVQTLTTFYTEPLSYRFSKGNYQSYKSTDGPLDFIEIPGFPGEKADIDKEIAVILLGFDGELSAQTNEEIGINDTIIINGFPSYLPKFKDISIINNDKLLSSAISSDAKKYASANNPFDTYNILFNIRRKNPNALFIIVPVGTKPMALGSCLFAIDHPPCRFIYPLPMKYKQKTTASCFNTWYYEYEFPGADDHNSKDNWKLDEC
jgi:hypothetical protein